MRKPIFLFVLITTVIVSTVFGQVNTIYTIRNCQKEMRTVTFQSQSNAFWKWILLKQSPLVIERFLFFSKDYHLDTVYLTHQVELVRKNIPSDYVRSLRGGTWVDNEPDEKAIWFTSIICTEDKTGKVHAYAAYKIIFEGNDARITEQRQEPKIKDIQFITDKSSLMALEKQIKILPLSR